MPGAIDRSAAPTASADRLISTAFSAPAVRGILWGAGSAPSNFAMKSYTYNAIWWSRGESNP